MSFCCGASMIGTKGTMKHVQTHIHNVPLTFCPVCHRVEVHFLIKQEYELLAEYAHSDGAFEIDFQEYIDEKSEQGLLENCVNHDGEDPLDVTLNQIDMALDLLTLANQIGDEEWGIQLKTRLGVLVKRRVNLVQRKRNSMGKRH